MKIFTKNILLALVSVFNIGAAFAQTYTTIYTKGGKAVEVMVTIEYPPSLLASYDEDARKSFPNATMLKNSSVKYNCHSYAWNLSDGGTVVCWINANTQDGSSNVSNYWTDGYYSETAEAKAQKIHYYLSDHSAVVSTAVSGMYESKWGKGPLMRHAPNYGPYLNMDSRKYYSHGQIVTPDPPVEVKRGNITCDAGDVELSVNQSANYTADMPSYSYSSMKCVIETAKGDDAVDAGYAIINKTFDGGVNVTFTRGGIYEMYLRFYNQSQKLVGEFFYEPVVAY